MTGWRKIDKPQPGEYATHAAPYLELTPEDGPILIHLQRTGEMLSGLYRSLPEERLLYRYATGKWTMKEVLLHLIDDERIYAYRALAIARGDTTPLPGFNQEAYALASRAMECLAVKFTAIFVSPVFQFLSISCVGQKQSN